MRPEIREGLARWRFRPRLQARRHAPHVTMAMRFGEGAQVSVRWLAAVLATGVAMTVPLALPAVATTSAAGPAGSDGQVARPLVAGHRGASSQRPEHTVAAYRLALRMHADSIETDVVATRDGVLVARHGNELSTTTDVEDHPEFTGRRRTKTVNGESVTGWFAEDFTLSALRTLRAEERYPELRPRSAAYDGRYRVPTLDRVLRLLQRFNAATGSSAGLLVEIKNSTYYRSIGLPLEGRVVSTLSRYGMNNASAGVQIQSMEVRNLRRLATVTSVPLMQVLKPSGTPYDQMDRGRSYADLTTPSGLTFVASYADSVVAHKDLVIPRTPTGHLDKPTALTPEAHTRGLEVFAYAFRPENTFLPADYASGADPGAPGDLYGEQMQYLRAGVDGLLTDSPAVAVATRDAYLSE